jgi:7-cyano-7-deazaguanine synthase
MDEQDLSKLAVVLLSGGMDSCVTAAIMRSRGYDLALLHATYGQRTAERELWSFNAIADFWGIESRDRLVVDVGYLAAIGGSSLTDWSIEVSAANLESKEIPTSYVPFRNANLLAIAASWAEVIGAEVIVIGAVEEDSSGYPDCRPAFFEAFERTINLGTRPETTIRIETPVISMRKSQIVRTGHDLGAPLDLTWSCYQSNGPEPCGVCDSCVLRARAFAEADVDSGNEN